MMMAKKLKINNRAVALMLSGGGAKGRYQLGVIRALEEAKLLKRVKAVSGVSIGAINTLLVITKQNKAARDHFWSLFTNDNIYKKEFRDFSFEEFGLFRTDHIFTELNNLISNEDIHKSKVDGYVFVAKPPETGLFRNLRFKSFTGEVIPLNEVERPLDYINASTAIPLVFHSRQVGEARYVDGGVVNNYPIEPLIERGHKFIITVALDTKFDPTPFFSDNVIINLSPQIDLGPFPQAALNFDPTIMAQFELLGYNNTQAMLLYLREQKLLRGRRFTIRKPILLNLNDVLGPVSLNSGE